MVRRILLSALVIAAQAMAFPVTARSATGPPITVRMGDQNVDATRYERGGYAWAEFPLWMTAPVDPFETHVGRGATTDPIGVTWLRDGEEVELPAGLVTSWRSGGFTNFFELTIRDRAGRQRGPRLATSWCPGGYGRTRVSIEGEDEPRYPDVCGGNPFTRYQVWGIEGGWAAPGYASFTFRVPDGQYRGQLKIAKRFRDAFGLPNQMFRFEIVMRTESFGYGGPVPRGQRVALEPDERSAVVTDPDPASLPDLASLPAWAIGLQREAGRLNLTFAATVWNAGPAPLIVDGFRGDGEDFMDAFQTFTLDGDNVGYAPVGTFEYDHQDGHQHWHFTDFAQYRLLDADGELVVPSQKEAFCLAPTDAEDLTVPGALWRPDALGFSQCGGLSDIALREVLQAGWGDTYFQSLPGQSFDVTDLPDGTYTIEVLTNPDGDLYEVTASNNRALRQVHLTRAAGRRIAVPIPYLGPL